MPDHPVLNLRRIRQIFGDQTSAIAEVLDSASRCVTELIPKLSVHLAAKDAQAVNAITHEITGLCGTVGAIELSELSSEMENMVRSEHWDAALARCHSLRGAVKRLQRAAAKDIYEGYLSNAPRS